MGASSESFVSPGELIDSSMSSVASGTSVFMSGLLLLWGFNMDLTPILFEGLDDFGDVEVEMAAGFLRSDCPLEEEVGFDSNLGELFFKSGMLEFADVGLSLV